jgi:hypothetical protein
MFKRRLGTAQNVGFSRQITVAETDGSVHDECFFQGMTRPLQAFANATQTVKFCFRCEESSTAMDATLYVILRKCDEDGSNPTTIINMDEGVEMLKNTLTSRYFTTTVDVSLTEGQRLVWEVGYRAANTKTNSYEAQIGFYNASATDLDENDSDMDQDNCWMELSDSFPEVADTFGDIIEVVPATTEEGTTVSATLKATPTAGDLLVAICIAGDNNLTLVCDTSGFTEDLSMPIDDAVGDDDVSIYGKLVASGSDNTVQMSQTTINDMALLLVLVAGPFASTPKDLAAESGEGTGDPWATGASGGSTAQADELMVGGEAVRNDFAEGSDQWDRQGTATPTTDLVPMGEAEHDTKIVTLAFQVLTATGTVGLSRPNPNSDLGNIGYVTYKKGSTGYTLVCAKGDFALTGKAMDPKASRLLPAAKGNFALTGYAAGLNRGYTLPAAKGDFALAGQAVGFLRDYAMPAVKGDFALTGIDAGLLHAATLAMAQGSFALSGQVVDFIFGYTMPASYGAFSLTGKDASLVKTSKMTADYGSFALTGQAVDFVFGFVMPAAKGDFALTGKDVGFLRDYVMPAAKGDFVLTGQDAVFLRDLIMLAAKGDFALTGIDMATILARYLSAGTGMFSLVGQPVTLTYSGGAAPADSVYVVPVRRRRRM